MPIPDSSPSPKKSSDPKFLPSLEVDELLTTLEHSHGLYYKMMNLEVWAIVETLDQFFPGSWGHFMTNRKVAMKQFLQRQQAKNAEGKDEGSSDLSDLSQGEESLADAIDNFVPPPLEEDGGATSSIPFPSEGEAFR